jgi:hypothetical protein
VDIGAALVSLDVLMQELFLLKYEHVVARIS